MLYLRGQGNFALWLRDLNSAIQVQVLGIWHWLLGRQPLVMFLSGHIQGIHLPVVSQLHSQLQPRSVPFSWLSFIPASSWDGINGWDTRTDGSRHQNSFQKTLSAHVTKAHFLQLLSTTFPHYSKSKIKDRFVYCSPYHPPCTGTQRCIWNEAKLGRDVFLRPYTWLAFGTWFRHLWEEKPLYKSVATVWFALWSLKAHLPEEKQT